MSNSDTVGTYEVWWAYSMEDRGGSIWKDVEAKHEKHVIDKFLSRWPWLVIVKVVKAR